MLLLAILKLFKYCVNMICLMLIDNRPSTGQISFVKTDDLFHIRAVPFRTV